MSISEAAATLVVAAPPSEASPQGDVFGGWMMGQLDIAGGIAATRHTKGRVATVAVESMQFCQPVYSYDVVSFYSQILRTGKTSITVSVEAFADRALGAGEKNIEVARAVIIFVSIEKPGLKKKLDSF